MKHYRNEVTIEDMNNFFLSMAMEYTWAFMWDVSYKDRNGVMTYKAVIRPNIIERLEFNHQLGVTQKVSSSNSLNFMPEEYNSSYCIEGKLLSTDSIMINGRSLGEDKKMRYAYSLYLDKLFKRIMSESICMEDREKEFQDLNEKIFGRRYAKLKDWVK